MKKCGAGGEREFYWGLGIRDWRLVGRISNPSHRDWELVGRISNPSYGDWRLLNNMSLKNIKPITRIMAPFAEAREKIRDGDLLLFRRRGVISIAGRGEHSHAAKAAWWEDDLFCLEVTQFCGGRAVTLASQVKRYPRRIDVYQVNPRNRWQNYDRAGAARFMRRLCGCSYGYLGILIAAFLHLPIVRWFVHPDLDDQAINRRPPFCSQACAMADRLGGGVDPVPHLADRLTEPADLARSPFYKYRFTLTK
jgi:hypothetical protein